MAGSTCHGPRGGQTPGQQGLTRRRFVAGGNRRGGGLGLAPPASKWTEESGYEELELTRARFSKQQQLGRPEMMASSSAAAAGARACSGLRWGARGGRWWGDTCYWERAEHEGVPGHELQ